MNQDKTKFRIVEERDGFNRNFYVEKRRRLFGLFPIWVRQVNPNHREHFGTSFYSLEVANEHIEKSCVPETKTIYHPR